MVFAGSSGRGLFISGGLLLACALAAGDEDEIRAAIAMALPVVEAGSRGSAEERRCFTCHHQGLPILVAIEARALGFRVDRENLDRQIAHTLAHLERGREHYERGTGQGGKADTAGMALWALRAAGHPPDGITGTVSDFLLSWNRDTPHWRPQSDRPPSEGSLFTSTYLALRGLEGYGREEARDRIAFRRSAARAWLETNRPEETEDAVFRLRALSLLDAETEEAGAELLALQREDGGWGQAPALPTEAYSTGSALVALEEAAVLSTDAEAYRRGLRFLLDSREDDGTWHVVSRSKPIQRPYESGFPHGKDQFISSSATCWALLALLRALPR